MAIYGGIPIGDLSHVVHSPAPIALQIDAFFGVSGLASLYGGSRGRVFDVQGVWVGTSTADIAIAESALLAKADGVARTLVDNMARTWANVIFTGEYSSDPMGPRPAAGGGWCLPFRARFLALT